MEMIFTLLSLVNKTDEISTIVQTETFRNWYLTCASSNAVDLIGIIVAIVLVALVVLFICYVVPFLMSMF